MPEPNFRRVVLRHSLGKKPIFTGFLVRPGSRKKFLASKACALAQLKSALKVSAKDSYSVAPVLKSCLIKLNKLPFVYTWDSNAPLYMSRAINSDPCRSLPKGKKYFFYVAPFITIRLDSNSKQAFQFWQRLAELVKRYPRACLNPRAPSPGFEIESSGGKRGGPELISRDRLNSKLAEARRFFREVEGIADEFLGK